MMWMSFIMGETTLKCCGLKKKSYSFNPPNPLNWIRRWHIGLQHPVPLCVLRVFLAHMVLDLPLLSELERNVSIFLTRRKSEKGQKIRWCFSISSQEGFTKSISITSWSSSESQTVVTWVWKCDTWGSSYWATTFEGHTWCHWSSPKIIAVQVALL